MLTVERSRPWAVQGVTCLAEQLLREVKEKGRTNFPLPLGALMERDSRTKGHIELRREASLSLNSS